MLDHISIAVADLAAARLFYDAVLGALDVPRVGEDEAWLGYGMRADAGHPERVYLSVRLAPPSARAAQAVHWAFKAPGRAVVDAFWAAGLAAGGTDDGRPGLRPHYHRSYYAAVLLDPSGNRIEAVCHAADWDDPPAA